MLHSIFLKIKKRKKRNAKFEIASKLKIEPIISSREDCTESLNIFLEVLQKFPKLLALLKKELCTMSMQLI